MSIEYISTTITATSALQSGCDRSDASEIVTISRASPDKIENWDVDDLGAVSSISLTNNNSASAVCMLTSASACVWTSTTNMDVVNLDSGYKANYTSSVATRLAQKGQQCAALPEYLVAIATTNTANSINKFTVTSGGTVFAAGTQSITALNGYTPTTIIALASSFLIGTEGGSIVEMNPDFTIVKTFQIPVEIDFTSSDRNSISGLSYYNGIVLANTSVGMMYQIDWMTLDVLNIYPFFIATSTAAQGSSLCVSSSGVSLVSIYNSGTGTKAYNFVAAIDYRQTPPKVDLDFLTLNTAQNVLAVGQQNGYGWAIYQNQSIVNFNVIPDDLVIQTPNPSILYESEYRQGQRILIIDDGNTRVESDIVLPANNTTTYTVTPSKTVIDAAFIDTGVAKLGSVSRYNT